MFCFVGCFFLRFLIRELGLQIMIAKTGKCLRTPNDKCENGVKKYKQSSSHVIHRRLLLKAIIFLYFIIILLRIFPQRISIKVTLQMSCILPINSSQFTDFCVAHSTVNAGLATPQHVLRKSQPATRLRRRHI